MVKDYKTVTSKKLRTSFYRDSYYRMFKWLFIYFFILVILVGLSVYSFKERPKIKYYAITQYGYVKQLTPL